MGILARTKSKILMVIIGKYIIKSVVFYNVYSLIWVKLMAGENFPGIQ